MATASAAAVVAGAIALIRFIHREDQSRLDRIAGTAHRQWHVVRWAKVVGRHVGIPFPLPDDIDDKDEWDEGLR